MSNKLKYFHTSDKQDWGTPQYIFDALNNEFGFTLDVCANENNAKCEKYYRLLKQKAMGKSKRESQRINNALCYEIKPI